MMTETEGRVEAHWIKWTGGECPVAHEAMVEIRLEYRDGTDKGRDGPEEAGHFDSLGWWTGSRRNGEATNYCIIAYRPVSQ